MRTLSLTSFLLLVSCSGKPPKDADTPPDDSAADTEIETGTEDTDTGTLDPDLDGDGSPASEDCDDSDPAVHPGAIEICDGLDNNCNTETDEGVLLTWYADDDGGRVRLGSLVPRKLHRARWSRRDSRRL